MADSVLMKLEEMLPEAAYFMEKEVFTEKEMRDIMTERRAHELAVNSSCYTIRDFLNYINHEIETECRRRERYEELKIKKQGPRDTSIIQRIHSLFNRCILKFSHDLSVWQKFIEFCASSGSSKALNRVLMRAIKRHPRVASLRIIAADRELHQGNLNGARKLLMRTVRIGTDNQLLAWEQLFKLECVAVHRIVTTPLKTKAQSTEGTCPTDEESEPTAVSSPSCQAAMVVYRHAVKDLSSNTLALKKFNEFVREALESLEMSILGFTEPQCFEQLKEAVRL